MLRVGNDGSIRLTRGDTARIMVSVINEIDGQEYTLQNDDRLTLTIKKTYRDSNSCFQKTISGSTIFHIEPSDTASLNFGGYTYDVQLTTSGGDVYTVVEPTTFEILPEVSW